MWHNSSGSPCDFSVGPSPFDLDFGTLDFGTSDSGLTIFSSLFKLDINAIQACMSLLLFKMFFVPLFRVLSCGYESLV